MAAQNPLCRFFPPSETHEQIYSGLSPTPGFSCSAFDKVDLFCHPNSRFSDPARPFSVDDEIDGNDFAGDLCLKYVVGFWIFLLILNLS